MTHICIIERRAESIEDLGATFEIIFAKRLDWLAQQLADADRPGSAELARRWAAEHRMMADRLTGAVPIGAGEDDPEATQAAIDFGGPLPGGRAA